MRVSSQKGLMDDGNPIYVDISYELCNIATNYNDPTEIVACGMFFVSNATVVTLAKYSSKEKSNKALLKLHHYYNLNSVPNVIFQFPQDDEL